jgi:hypothetical protein
MCLVSREGGQLPTGERVGIDTSSAGQRLVLMDHAAMIQQASERSVPKEADRADIRRRNEEVLAAEARLAGRGPAGSTAPG